MTTLPVTRRRNCGLPDALMLGVSIFNEFSAQAWPLSLPAETFSYIAENIMKLTVMKIDTDTLAISKGHAASRRCRGRPSPDGRQWRGPPDKNFSASGRLPCATSTSPTRS